MIRGGKLVKVSDVAELRTHVGIEFEISGTIGDLSGVVGVSDVSPLPDGVRVRVTGSPAPLLAALSSQDVTGLRTREASLEEIFLSYYDESTSPVS